MTSGVGREGSLGCSASSVPPERLRLSLIEGISEIKFVEEADFRGCRRVEGLGDESVELPLVGVSFRGRVSMPRVPQCVAKLLPRSGRSGGEALAFRSLSNSFQNV